MVSDLYFGTRSKHTPQETEQCPSHSPLKQSSHQQALLLIFRCALMMLSISYIISLLTNSSRRVLPSEAGLLSTTTPAPSSAEILLSAPPLPPDTMAPAWPILLPGGAEIPAMKLTTGFLPALASFKKSAASSSAAPPISPIMMIPSVSGSSRKTRRQSMKLVPEKGSPPIPTTRDWPSPA